MRFLSIFLVVLATFGCKKKKRTETESPRSAAIKPVTIPRDARPSVFAAQGWYDADRAALTRQLEGFLAGAPPLKGCDPMALVVPHAGYRFSGRTAGRAFSLWKGKKPRRVIVLGLSHRAGTTRISVGRFTHYETPLGDLPVDRVAVDHLLKAAPELFTFTRSIHEVEHSAEMELPFIRALFGPVPTLTVLVGRIPDGAFLKAARHIAELVNEGTLIVASSDFTHRGPRYHYTPLTTSADVRGDLKKLDMGAFEQIALLDRKGLVGYRRRTGITMCGVNPVGVLMGVLLHAKGHFTPRVVAYETSGDITGDWANTVSYLGIAFCKKDRDLYYGLDALQRRTLHTIAARVVADVTRQGFDPEGFDPANYRKGLDVSGMLSEPKAPFVTLKKKGRLRGCIGYLRPHGPLWEAVAHNALSAALRDRRFRPVTADEVKDLHVEISVLSMPRAVASPSEIVLGTHGIILKMGPRRATYLPQVAAEQKWDLDTTLRHLARKAGLSPDSYPQASYEVYTAQVF